MSCQPFNPSPDPVLKCQAVYISVDPFQFSGLLHTHGAATRQADTIEINMFIQKYFLQIIFIFSFTLSIYSWSCPSTTLINTHLDICTKTMEAEQHLNYEHHWLLASNLPCSLGLINIKRNLSMCMIESKNQTLHLEWIDIKSGIILRCVTCELDWM